MPAQILHTLFGEDVADELRRRLPNATPLCDIIHEHHAVFMLGCQGPDVLYHNQMTRPVGLEYVSLLHRRDFGNFAAALLELSGDYPNNPAPLVYALGFMTHALLDRQMHPYIVYKSGMAFKDAHPFLERLIDALMLELLRGQKAAQWEQAALAAVCFSPPAALHELLFKALVAVFPERAGKDEKLALRIANTFQDCALFYHLTDPARGESASYEIPRVYHYPKRFPLFIDYLNLGQNRWRYPVEGGAWESASFPALYRRAVECAFDTFLPLYSAYLERGAFPPNTAETLGNEGLSVQDRDGKPCAPTLLDPLPLELVLE
jgi:hypothetical protein